MTIEDRLRATTEAVTATMRPVRPLDLHPDPAAVTARRRPGRRRVRSPRERPGWLVPLAAALVVVAVAATLVAVRSLSGTDSGSPPVPAATSTSVLLPAAGLPQYFVEINGVDGVRIAGVPTGAALIGETSTGKRLRTFLPPSGFVFAAATLAGSSDDRTFVLQAVPGAGTGTSLSHGLLDTWDVLRLTPGADRPLYATTLQTTVSAADDDVEGVAVSPDGGTLAILYQPIEYVGARRERVSTGPSTLRTYSLSTRRALRTWTAPAADTQEAYNFADLTWLDDDRTLAFAYPAAVEHRYMHTLDTTGPGTGLLSASRTVLGLPKGHVCGSEMLMTADGKSVICGSTAEPETGWCATGQLAFTAYSVATGKLDRTLYRYQGGCTSAAATVVWAKSAGLAIGTLTISKPGKQAQPILNEVGILTAGKFTALPGIQVGTGTFQDPTMIAF